MASSIGYHSLFLLLHLFVILLHLVPKLALSASHTTVKYLPGFEGPLPFHLETGYVGVGESEEVQLFYYFTKSERNPKEDPLVLWMTGGPGCSTFSALAFEIGPFSFKVEEYNGSLPALILNPHSWTKVSNIIYLDIPVKTGFSYTESLDDSLRSDSNTVLHAHQFIRKWLLDHPEYLSNTFYVGGDSYSGITVPAIALEILNGNEAGIEPSINLQGYLLGNPKTEERIEENFAIPFAHGFGLISDELYESLRTNCGGDYFRVNPSNELCLRDIQTYNKMVSGVFDEYILEPKCAFASPKPPTIFGQTQRSLLENKEIFLNDLDPTIGCRTYGYLLTRYWVNNNEVLKALGIRKGSIRKWQRCSYSLPYTQSITSSVPYHAKFSTTGYRTLIYNGDHDMVVPFLGTQAWVRSLNYSIIDDWRPWFVEGQVAGYTRTYSNRMTFATVKGGGHTVPEYRPKECFAMFRRWISGMPL